MKLIITCLLVMLVLPLSSHALSLSEQNDQSLDRLEKNISHPEVIPGVVIASPSRKDPDYFFHWIRDAALVMEGYVDLLSSADPNLQKIGSMRLENWLKFETMTQKSAGLDHLGEPKFNVDGSLFTGPWGRPQNDGPALRARTLALWAQKLISSGSAQFAYDHILNEFGPLKNDLRYTVLHWQEPSFDVWEEVKGDHFFTRLAQLKSVQLSAHLFSQAGDKNFAKILEALAREMNQDIQSFWVASENKIYPTLKQVEGWDHKKSNLDLTILLASLYFTIEKEEFGLSDSRVISSIKKLKDSFSNYQINQSGLFFLGRYPEDVYDGLGFSGGNPWFLANTAYAQFQCRLAHEWGNSKIIKVDRLNQDFLKEYLLAPQDLKDGEILNDSDPRFALIISGLKDKAALYLNSLLYHVGRDGAMSEQFSRSNGYMEGATDLSWSHASFRRAINECQQVLPNLL